MRRLALGLALALALAAPLPARADFASGVAAFDGGDFATALGEWRSLAETGDPEAQAALASLYRHGQGVGRDDAEAARWYRRAAEQGEVNGQLNLGELYALGLGVPRDPLRAYLWLSLAAHQGRRWAARRRDALAEDMDAAELGAARRLVRDWKPVIERRSPKCPG